MHQDYQYGMFRYLVHLRLLPREWIANHPHDLGPQSGCLLPLMPSFKLSDFWSIVLARKLRSSACSWTMFKKHPAFHEKMRRPLFNLSGFRIRFAGTIRLHGLGQEKPFSGLRGEWFGATT
jgi:hypothetical protein